MEKFPHACFHGVIVVIAGSPGRRKDDVGTPCFHHMTTSLLLKVRVCQKILIRIQRLGENQNDINDGPNNTGGKMRHVLESYKNL
jgi:hypothetical protein